MKLQTLMPRLQAISILLHKRYGDFGISLAAVAELVPGESESMNMIDVIEF